MKWNVVNMSTLVGHWRWKLNHTRNHCAEKFPAKRKEPKKRILAFRSVWSTGKPNDELTKKKYALFGWHGKNEKNVYDFRFTFSWFLQFSFPLSLSASCFGCVIFRLLIRLLSYFSWTNCKCRFHVHRDCCCFYWCCCSQALWLCWIIIVIYLLWYNFLFSVRSGLALLCIWGKLWMNHLGIVWVCLCACICVCVYVVRSCVCFVWISQIDICVWASEMLILQFARDVFTPVIFGKITKNHVET